VRIKMTFLGASSAAQALPVKSTVRTMMANDFKASAPDIDKHRILI